MPPRKGKGPATAENADAESSAQDSEAVPNEYTDADSETASTADIQLRCSIMEAQKTVHKFCPGNVTRAEATSVYINWASKMQSWLILVGIDGLLQLSEAEI